MIEKPRFLIPYVGPRTTLTKAFAEFQVTANHIRTAWSASSVRPARVVLAVWERDFDCKHGRIVIKSGVPPPDKIGHRNRLRDLLLARDRCKGLFNVVLVIPTRNANSFWPCPDLTMKLTRLEPNGQIEAVQQRTR